MVAQAPVYVPMAEKDKEVIEVDVFCCCRIGQKYVGGSVHNPDDPSDGPWYTTVKKDGVLISFGFGSRAEALSTAEALSISYDQRVEIDVEDDVED